MTEKDDSVSQVFLVHCHVKVVTKTKVSVVIPRAKTIGKHICAYEVGGSRALVNGVYLKVSNSCLFRGFDMRCEHQEC